MKNLLDNFVEIIENKSKKHSTHEIVSICKRVNNVKRDFLFTNNYQGKYIPQTPSKILELFDELIENIKIGDEKVLLIGFAETATAIGNYLASKLPNCIYEMQTTREKFKGEIPLIEFKEEHSHATEQLLYGKKEIFENIEKIIFVDDEITTGKTIINCINEINKISKLKIKYEVVSILNWQDDESIKKFEDLEIDTCCLIKGKIKDLQAKVDVQCIENKLNIENTLNGQIKITNINSELCNLKSTRFGRVPIKDVYFYSNYIYDRIKMKSKLLNEILKTENKSILVLGTEEFMYEPLLFAKFLEENVKAQKVCFHATSRSPIEVSNEENYVLNSRYYFNSCYEEGRITNIYNLQKYDYVFIVTDSFLNNKFIEDISNIFNNLKYNLENIEILRFQDYLF